MVWLIRAIINGNIIIQASISKRSHLNEYIFCLRAVAASEPLKRKERKTGEATAPKPERGVGRSLHWKQELGVLGTVTDPRQSRDLGQDQFPLEQPRE